MNFHKTLIYNYYSEIKYRLLYSAIMSFCTFLICYLYKVELLLLLTDYVSGYNVHFIYTRPTELLFFYIELSILASSILLILYSVINILFYFTPALYKREFRHIIKFGIILFLYIIGCIFFILKLIIPYLTSYLISLNSDTYQLHYVYNVKSSELLYYFVAITLIFLLLLLIPLVIFYLFVYVSPNTTLIHRIRIYTYIAILLISAILSPGEWLIQFLLTGVLLILMELGILIYSIYINI